MSTTQMVVDRGIAGWAFKGILVDVDLVRLGTVPERSLAQE
jgi:hypothetical protein